jgi:hypothetical protein
MTVSIVHAMRRWFSESGLYVALWVAGVASALYAGRDPGYWWDWREAWPYPWAETLITLAVVTIEVTALRAWLGPRSRTTALWRWLTATTVFIAIATWVVFHLWTDQPGWVYARWQLALLITLGLIVRLAYEVLRRAVRYATRARPAKHP